MAGEPGAPSAVSESTRATKKRGSSSRSLSPIVAPSPGATSAQSDPGPAVSSPKRMVEMRRQAESPSAPTRDVSLSELTHAYQHLAAQAELDKT